MTRKLNFILIQNINQIIKGFFLDVNHPATKLFEFSAPDENVTDQNAQAAYANIVAAKKLQTR